jgi:hypothetical protein
VPQQVKPSKDDGDQRDNTASNGSDIKWLVIKSERSQKNSDANQEEK